MLSTVFGPMRPSLEDNETWSPIKATIDGMPYKIKLKSDFEWTVEPEKVLPPEAKAKTLVKALELATHGAGEGAVIETAMKDFAEWHKKGKPVPEEKQRQAQAHALFVLQTDFTSSPAALDDFCAKYGIDFEPRIEFNDIVCDALYETWAEAQTAGEGVSLFLKLANDYCVQINRRTTTYLLKINVLQQDNLRAEQSIASAKDSADKATELAKLGATLKKKEEENEAIRAAFAEAATAQAASAAAFGKALELQRKFHGEGPSA